MSFNPGSTKQVQEVIFSRKTGKGFYPNLYCNGQSIEGSVAHNYLGPALDEKTINY